MEVTVEKSSELQRTLKVKVPSEELQGKIDARLREIGKQVKIKGFRPGRIPQKVLMQRYGKSVQHEVVSEVVQSSLFEAIERESLRPASNPVLEDLPDMGAGDDFEFTASIEVYPDIQSIDVSGIEIRRPDAEVTEQDVDEMLQTLRQQRQTWADTEDTPREGHLVTVEFVAETGEGKVPEEGRQGLNLVMGATGFDALESAVAGLKAGDSGTFDLEFPEHYGDEKLAGKKASVELEVMKVQQPELPEIDEDFIRSFAVESGEMEDMRKEVRGNLERELETATKSWLKAQLVSSLLSTYADLDVPDSIVRQEAESLRNRVAQQRGQEPADIEVEPFTEQATRRVRSGLLLAEIARQNHISTDGARVRKAIESVAETYEQPLEVVQMYYGNQQLLQGVENLVLEEQVVDWVMEQAKVDGVKMAFKAVINEAAMAGQTL